MITEKTINSVIDELESMIDYEGDVMLWTYWIPMGNDQKFYFSYSRSNSKSIRHHEEMLDSEFLGWKREEMPAKDFLKILKQWSEKISLMA